MRPRLARSVAALLPLSLVAACSGSVDAGTALPACDSSPALPDPARDAERLELVAADPGPCPADPTMASWAGLCTYEVECQGGSSQFVLSQGWTTAPGSCSLEADSCPSLGLVCSHGHWTHAGGTDEPHVCPWEPPKQGAACSNPAMAIDACGYWCAGATTGTWTVATCERNDDSGGSVWHYDGACSCP